MHRPTFFGCSAVAALLGMICSTAIGQGDETANILPNGGFEQVEDQWPAGWPRGDSRVISLAEEDGNRFLRWQMAEPTAAMIGRKIELPEQTQSVRVSLRIRGAGFACGEQADWMTARCEFTFENSEGERVGGYPWTGGPPEGDSDWTTYQREERVPVGATHLIVTIGSWGGRGVVDIDDVRVEAIESPLAEARRRGYEEGFPQGHWSQMAAGSPPQGWTVSDADAVQIVREGDRQVLQIQSDEPSWAQATMSMRVEPDWTSMRLAFAMNCDDLRIGPETQSPRPMRWRQAGVHVAFLDERGEEIGPGVGSFAGPHMDPYRDRPGWLEFQTVGGVPTGARAMTISLGFFNMHGTVLISDLMLEPSAAVVFSDAELPAEHRDQWDRAHLRELTPARSQIDLTGPWRFVQAEGQTQQEPRAWGWIKVPGNWQEGGDILARGDSRDWLNYQGQHVSRAWYQRELTVPASWADRAVVLQLDRVSTDAEVFINGESVGMVNWPGGEADLTPHVRPGQVNTIRLRVIAADDRDQVPIYMGYVETEMAAAKLEQRGLIGPVTLLSRPRAGHVAGVLVRPSTRQHKLFVDVELANVAQAGRAMFIARLLDEQGRIEKQFEQTAAIAAAGQQTVTVAFDWSDPRLWDIGQPNVYTLQLSVRGEMVDDAITQEFGFREFWIDGRDFYLNNTLVRLRPGNLDYGGLPSNLVDRGMNFGHMWPRDLTRRGSRLDYPDRIVADAGRIGILISANMAHMGEYANRIDQWEKPEIRAEYQRQVDYFARRWRNQPQIVMWTHSANVFQNQVDGTPWLIGMRDFSNYQEYVQRVQNAQQAIAMIKAVDPTRPVYAHFGTYAGEVYTSNMYLNFLPLQEREEWLSHWAARGELPFMAVEMGPPLYASVMRGRSGYTHQGHSEPFPSEWGAVYFGRRAYDAESDEFRALIRERYRGEDQQAEYQPHIRHDGKDRLIQDHTAFKDVLDLFILQTWRSWRTMGVSGGMIAWHHDAMDTLARVNGDSLAWIAGDGGPPQPGDDRSAAFTDKTHHYRAGDTLRKQIVLINDHRREADYRLTWTVTLEGERLGGDTLTGRLDVSQTLFLPIAMQLPSPIAEPRRRGTITLTATIGGDEHDDSFVFDVFSPAAQIQGTLSVFDPRGDTADLLRSIGLNVMSLMKDGSPQGDAVVIGRHALSDGGVPGFNIEAYVRGGGRVVIMSQDPQWFKFALHLRTAPHLSRRVFRVNQDHPVTAALDDDNLRDWNGAATLVDGYHNFPGFEWVPEYGWRWGNRHSVSSAPIEKPHRSSWRPILEGEFDSAYSPLMELDYGEGRITLCTLDLEGRTHDDPAADRLARQLFDHVLRAPLTPPADAAVYLGGDASRATLDFLGMKYESAETPRGELVILGPDAVVADAALRGYVEAGGQVLVLRREQPDALLGARLSQREAYHGSLDVPDWPEAAGLSPSDLRYRAETSQWLLEGGDNIEVGAGGQLGRMTIGRGVIIFAQLGPDAVPADEMRYFRFTRWRQTRALSQVLANLGATFEQDRRFLTLLQSPDHHVNLAGSWQVAAVKPLPESPTRQWHAFEPISDAAAALVETSAEGPWQDVLVPSYLEAYGPEWRWVDGEFVFRREINWPVHAAGKRAFLSLGRVDENEISFVNGVEVGRSRHWLFPRGHYLEAGVLKPGRNTIAVRVWDEGIHGGMAGSPNHIYLTVEGDDPGFYHPDYITSNVSRSDDELDWQARHEQWKIADDPYRYYRW